MAIKTQLSPTALPGRSYSFAAKTAADAVKGAGPFTALSVTALPGKISNFIAKTPSVTTSEQVTALSVAALPGPVRTFTAKTLAETVALPAREAHGSGGMLGIKPKFTEKKIDKYRAQILREDEEIREVIMAFVLGND